MTDIPEAAHAFRPVQQDLEFDLPPTFTSVDDERRHRKGRLAIALRVFGRFGFGEGVAGHITARDPELTDHFWVNPFGMSFRRITVGDLILVNHDGVVVHGRKPVNAAAFAIHSRIHAARPDVVAGIQRMSSGTSVPSPRTCRTIGPRLTVSIQSVPFSTPGAAGSSCERPAVTSRLTTTAATLQAIRRCRFRRATCGVATSISWLAI